MESKYYNINLNYCRASTGKRLANYLIDLFVFYIMLFLIGFSIEILFPGSISQMNISGIIDRLISIILYALIMFIIETAFEGKSLGKLITGTKAINIDGEPLTFYQYLSRNFIRAIPFNSLSALGSPCSPWHDQWSKSIVVDESLLEFELRKQVFYTAPKNQMQ